LFVGLNGDAGMLN